MNSPSKKVDNQKSKIEYILFAQVIACLGVIFNHCNECFWNFSTERYWFTANIIESFFYFPVQIFFMVTGITLIDYQKKYSTKEFLLKRFSKTLIPFLAWSLLGVVYMYALGRVNASDITIKSVWNNVWTFGFVDVFWFFVPLFGIYLCMPILSAVPEEKRKSTFTYLIVAVFLIHYIPDFLIKVVRIEFVWPVSVDVADGYLIFPMVGYLLYKYPPSKKWRILIYLSGAFVFLMHCVGTYVVSMAVGHVTKIFKGNITFIGLIYGIAFFVFFQQIGDKVMKVRWINKIVRFLSKYQMPLYLMQWFIMDFAVTVCKVDNRSIIYRLGFPFVLIAIVVVVTWIMRKIPILREIVP